MDMDSDKTNLFDGRGTEVERRGALHTAQAFLAPESQQLAQVALKSDAAVFSTLEPGLLGEARTRAQDSGRLVPFKYRDDTGRKVTAFEGDPMAWMKHFMSPGGTARIDRDAARGVQEQTVKLLPGQRVKIVGAGE